MLRAVHEKCGRSDSLPRDQRSRPFDGEGLPVENVRWSSSTEAEDLAGIDIGIMPLPDDVWSRGKCGFKGLQYMAMGKAGRARPGTG